MSAPRDEFLDTTLPNGLRIFVAHMPQLLTLSVQLRLPLGTIGDPDDAEGLAVVLHEWLQRGAEERDAREQADAFERLGARRGGGVGRESAALGMVCLARDAAAALPLLAASVVAPRLADDEFEGARQLALQALAARDDAPNRRLFEAAVAARFAAPHGRSAYGRRRHLQRLGPERVRGAVAERVAPDGSVLVMAGGGDPEALASAAALAFGAWRGGARRIASPTVRPAGRRRVRSDGAQTHIALVDSAVRPGEPGWPEQALAMTALAGAGGSRLWTEVRERRGLAYEVDSGVHTLAGDAFRTTVAATAPERVRETLRVLRRELQRLRGGLDAAELERARTLLRASLVLEGESSGGRVARLATDLWRLGRVRTTEEVLGALEAVTLERVNAFLAERPPLAATVVTVGRGRSRTESAT